MSIFWSFQRRRRRQYFGPPKDSVRLFRTSERLATSRPLSGAVSCGFDAEAVQSQIRAKSDEIFWRAATWARLQRTGNAHVYLYRSQRFRLWRYQSSARSRTVRAALFFGYPSTALLAAHEGAEKAALHTQIENQIQDYWVNFAMTGDPNGPGLPQWPRFTAKTQKAMDMADDFEEIDLPERPAIDLLGWFPRRA